jgi:hypothetical protein
VLADIHGELDELALQVADPLPWKPGRPARNTARLTLSTADYAENAELDFGLRFSELREGRFFLNRNELLMKGVLVQPNYPLELVRPHDPSLLDREIGAILQRGSNLARVHLRPPAPGSLECADSNNSRSPSSSPWTSWSTCGGRLSGSNSTTWGAPEQ